MLATLAYELHPLDAGFVEDGVRCSDATLSSPRLLHAKIVNVYSLRQSPAS